MQEKDKLLKKNRERENKKKVFEDHEPHFNFPVLNTNKLIHENPLFRGRKQFFFQLSLMILLFGVGELSVGLVWALYGAIVLVGIHLGLTFFFFSLTCGVGRVSL